MSSVSARALREAPVAVLGAGSWGTALAIQFAHGGRPVRLWGRDRAQLAEMATSRRNERYLPSAGFPESLRVEPDLPRSLSGARDVLIVVPSHAFRPLLRLLAPQLAPEPHVVWATKGFEQGSLKLPHQIAREVLGAERRVAVLSGPTFAREVGAGLPTAMTVASPDASYARALAQELSSANFRALPETLRATPEIVSAHLMLRWLSDLWGRSCVRDDRGTPTEFSMERAVSTSDCKVAAVSTTGSVLGMPRIAQ